MSNKNFKASNWFLTGQPEVKNIQNNNNVIPSAVAHALAPFIVNKSAEKSSISDYFIPSWDGSTPHNQEVTKFNEIINKVHKDVFEQFLTLKRFTPKLRKGIYEEFLFFAEHLSVASNSITDVHSFWEEIEGKNSKHKDILNQFINIYTFRTAIIYIFKVRFITTLINQTEREFDIKSILYPSSFLTSLFKQGSSTELSTKALQQNIFSWYRPSDSMEPDLFELNDLFSKLGVSEIIQIISNSSEKILSTDTTYSNSLSHKHFGLFTNSILINFPLWLSTHKGDASSNVNYKAQGMEVLSTKFSGDHLESLALSHWLAQESNRHIKWDQIICPDFKRHNFATGNYLKIVNELQFLTFLAQIADEQGHDPIRFVSKISKAHMANRKDSDDRQKSLLLNEMIVKKSTYDRVVLNIANFPKNNSSHYLISQIQQQIPYLKSQGLLYIQSTKNLFVPSQKAKVDQLLEKLNIKAIFNFSEVSGKGEVGSYIYIFSKKSEFSNIEKEKNSCLHFRFSTELESFHHFSHIIRLTQDFFIANLGEKPAIYQKEFDNVRLEFYQDAIVDGRLLHSSNNDSTKITHPQFFQNLMSNCKPLDHYFEITPVKLNENNTTSLLDELDSTQDSSQLILIVDQRSKNKTKIELINKNDFERFFNEYGQWSCNYFHFSPKKSYIDIQLVNNFYKSSVGCQIIDLIFNNQSKKIKSNLEKLLFPTSLVSPTQMPESINLGLDLFSLTTNEILEMHPKRIKDRFNEILLLSDQISKSYPASYIKHLSGFEANLKIVQEILGSKNKKLSLNFNNPLIKSPLLLSPTNPIYPHNNDVFIDFASEHSMSLIHSPLSKIKRVKNLEQGVENFAIEVYTEDTKVITLFSDENMSAFLEYILSNISGVSIAQILQNVRIPSIENLAAIIESYNSMLSVIDEISEQIPKILDQLMISLVNR